jgi:hypothetical protein
VDILEWAAWIISAGLGIWMVYDLLKTGREHDEAFLTTSVEGTDELFDPNVNVGEAR